MAMICVAVVAAGVLPWIFDANGSHMFNPEWSAHARLHDAIAVCLATLTAMAGLVFLCFRDVRRHSGLFRLAAMTGLLPWVAILAAGLVPGTAYANPDAAADHVHLFGSELPGPVFGSVLFLTIGCLGIIFYPTCPPRGAHHESLWT